MLACYLGAIIWNLEAELGVAVAVKITRGIFYDMRLWCIRLHCMLQPTGMLCYEGIFMILKSC